jgi:hypothetical protein
VRQVRLELPELHPGQEQVKAEARRFNALACGRRWGKTVIGLDLVIDTALVGGKGGWFAPEYRLLREAWRDLRQLCGDVATFNEQERRADFITGGSIEFWAFDRNPNAGRSRKYHRLVVDEAAHCDNLEVVWTKALRPTLTDYKGDAWFLSSPNGRNYFHTLFKLGQRSDGPWKSWQRPSLDNPYLDPAEIEDARRDLPEPVFAQEYLAEFLDETLLQLIAEHWLDPCWLDQVVPIPGPRGLALDISKGTGRDRTVAIVGSPAGLLALVVGRTIGVRQAADLAAELSVQWGVPHDRITYDAGGWAGPDMGRYLEALGILAAVPYHGGAPGGPRWKNRRTRSAWRLRQRLDPDRPKLLPARPPVPDVSYPEVSRAKVLPPPPRALVPPPFAMPLPVLGGHSSDLKRELLELRYQYGEGRLELEAKAELQSRLGHSPDLADTLMMLASLWDEV